MIRNNGLKKVFVLLAAFAVTGCQSLPLRTPEAALEKRVEAMMTARVNGDWATVYDYLDPEYRKKVSMQSFLGISRGVELTGFSVESFSIDESGKEADVTVAFDMIMMSFKVKDQRETQNWVKHGGKWYFKVKTETGAGASK